MKHLARNMHDNYRFRHFDETTSSHALRERKMVLNPATTRLKNAIREFADEVESPIDLNDLESCERWKSRVNELFDRMSELVDHQRKQLHTKVFTEIATQDPASREEIQQLRKSDQRIEDYMDVVKAHLAAFVIADKGDIEGRELHMSELQMSSQQLVESLLAQEDAVASWFAESFDPDAS